MLWSRASKVLGLVESAPCPSFLLQICSSWKTTTIRLVLSTLLSRYPVSTREYVRRRKQRLDSGTQRLQKAANMMLPSMSFHHGERGWQTYHWIPLTGTSETLSMVYPGSSTRQISKGIVLSGEIARTLLGDLCRTLEKTPDFREMSHCPRVLSRDVCKQWFFAVCCGPKVL